MESPIHSDADSSTPVTPVKLESSVQISPILGGGAKRRLTCRKMEMENNNKSDEEDDDMANFEPGSNKWECIELPENDSYDFSPDETEPLERLKRLKKWSGLETSTKTVSTKIRGAERRAMPGQTCWQCNQYYEANNFGTQIRNKVSRHRCNHKRVPSPKGYWDLDL
ncbi:Protein gamma response 1 [Frankliniella fusca]|nr:Protein gamma response 1 [Frankliniella fusca]